jgi:hypothetical protein
MAYGYPRVWIPASWLPLTQNLFKSDYEFWNHIPLFTYCAIPLSCNVLRVIWPTFDWPCGWTPPYATSSTTRGPGLLWANTRMDHSNVISEWTGMLVFSSTRGKYRLPAFSLAFIARNRHINSLIEAKSPHVRKSTILRKEHMFIQNHFAPHWVHNILAQGTPQKTRCPSLSQQRIFPNLKTHIPTDNLSDGVHVRGDIHAFVE